MVTPIIVQNIEVWSFTQSIPLFLPSDSRGSRNSLSVFYPVRRSVSGALLHPSESRISRYNHSLNQYLSPLQSDTRILRNSHSVSYPVTVGPWGMVLVMPIRVHYIEVQPFTPSIPPSSFHQTPEFPGIVIQIPIQ